MITIAFILIFLLLTTVLATGTGWNNVLSPDRNDLVFAGRNRDYGAYKLRQEHHRTMVIALFAGSGIMCTMVLLPTVFRTADQLVTPATVIEIDDKVLDIIIPISKPAIADAKPELPRPRPRDPLVGAGVLVAVDSVPKIEVDTTTTVPDPDPNPGGSGAGTGGDPGGSSGAGSRSGVGDEVRNGWELDKNPEYPGGDKALAAYLSRSIRYPVDDIEEHREGRVTVGFIVRTDGSVTDVTILQGVSLTIDAEAIRVVKAMRKWIPGKFKQQEANVRYALPIVFTLRN